MHGENGRTNQQRTQADGTCSPFCVQFDHSGTSDEGIIHLERSKLVGTPSVRCDPIQLSEEPLSESDEQEPTGADDDSRENGDTIAMATAPIVIENTHLREVIQHLRDTISGLTDHKLL